MSFTFNTGIPDSANNPSFDQPDMKTNNQSNLSIWNVDHRTFNANDSGTHKKVTYIDIISPTVPPAPPAPPIPSDPISIEYTAPGIAEPSHPQLFWKNSQGTFPQSAIRAFGAFTLGVTPAFVPNASFNVTGAITYTPNFPTPGFFDYRFNIVTNAVNGNTPVLIVPATNFGKELPIYGYASDVISFTYTTTPDASDTQYFLIIQI